MNKKNITNISLVFLSGLLFYLAFLFIPFLIWFAFVPLIILSRRNRIKTNLGYALFLAFLISSLCFYWTVYYNFLSFFLLFLYVSSLFFIYQVLLHFIFKKFRNAFLVFAPALLWILIYWIYSHFTIGSFWVNTAVFQVQFGFVNQFLGEIGFNFLIVFVNTLIAYIILEKNKASYVIPLIFILLILFPAYYYGQHKEVEGRRVRVAMVQGNFTQEIDWRIENAEGIILNDYIRLTREVVAEKPDLVIWPEYAIPTDLLAKPEVYQKISDLARELNINLILGTFVKELEGDDEKWYDTVLVFNRAGELIERYDALSPFQFQVENEMEAGNRHVVVETDVGKIALTVCFDEMFNKIYKEYDELGADYFVSLSNNAPFKSFLGMRLGKRFSELRAAVYNKYFIRATNSGFSQVINPFGEIIQKLPINTQGYTTVDIYVN